MAFPDHGLRSRASSFAKNLCSLKSLSFQEVFSQSTFTPDFARDKNVWLFESSYEICNKVGGIYTVVRSKAGECVKEFGNQYILLGPYKAGSAHEIEQTESPHPAINSIINQMKGHGINIVHGKWLIEGSPTVILFDTNTVQHKYGEWRDRLITELQFDVEDHGRYHSVDAEVRDCMLYGFLCNWFLSEFSRLITRSNPEREPQLIAHFHEWQAGFGLILLSRQETNVATIFTTHATILGRHLCAADEDLYANLCCFDVDAKAHQFGIKAKFMAEKHSAHHADIFSTVSGITGKECEFLLDKVPDIILPNGLNVTKYTALHEFQNLHSTNKEKLHNFIRGHFRGNLDFDLDTTLYFFSAGRYEYRNKGLDILIESLARLNHQLKDSNVTIVCFLIFQDDTHQGFNTKTLHGQAVYRQIQATVAKVTESVRNTLRDKVISGETPSNNMSILSDEDIQNMKVASRMYQTDELPSITTHNLDPKCRVNGMLNQCRLFNHKTDRVKVIYHPQFLNELNPVLSISYPEFVRANHMGVFASYYEPWGYTPAECTIMGVPSISTNLAGFGSYVQENISDPNHSGLYVVDRLTQDFDAAANDLCQIMLNYTKLTRRQRILLRNRTERLGDIFDWQHMITQYRIARIRAMQKKNENLDPFIDELANLERNKPFKPRVQPISRGSSPTSGVSGTTGRRSRRRSLSPKVRGPSGSFQPIPGSYRSSSPRGYGSESPSGEESDDSSEIDEQGI